MRVRIVDGKDQPPRDVEVTVHDPLATVGDLVEAVSDPPATVRIDGRALDLAGRLDRSGLGDGVLVEISRHPGAGERGPARPPDRPVVLVTVTGGFDVGHRSALGPGPTLVLRDEAPARPRVPRGSTTGRLTIEDPTLGGRRIGLMVGADGSVAVRPLGIGPTVRLDGQPVEPVVEDAARGAGCLPLGRLARLARFLPARARQPLPGWDPPPTESPRRRPAQRDPAPGRDDPQVRMPVGSRLDCGAASVEVTDLDLDHDLDATPAPPRPGARSSPIHRIPRRPEPEPRPPLDPPAPPEAPPAVTPVGVIALVGSLLMGAVLVVLLHSWTYAAFALLGPVLMVANAVDSRRRRRRVRRRGARRRRGDLAMFADALEARAADERRRLERIAAGPLDAVHRVRSAPSGCWERRPAHDDAFLVRLGTGTIPWKPPVSGDPSSHAADVADTITRHATVTGAPVACRLEPGAPLALVGPRVATAALARSIVVQAAVLHGPVDLRAGVLTEPAGAGRWQWMAWLPHAWDAEGDTLLAATDDEAERVVGVITAASTPAPTAAVAIATDPTSARPRTVVVVDDPAGLTARRSPVRSMLRAAVDPGRGLVPIVLVNRPDDVPAACTIVVHVDEDGGLRGARSLTAGTATVLGMGRATADDVARRLARFDDPEVDDAGRNLPGEVTLGPLLGPDPFDAGALADRWRASGADPPPVAVLGQELDGSFAVDLAADGPHVLVAGTTGAGKSELLRTLVASLALGQSPRHLTFVLIDFKGGSAFDACARLPHTTGMVTDLDDQLAARALRCLEAELRHRELRLRAAGVDDLPSYRRVDPDGEALPRLVVVIDEFATLAAELPDFVDALVGIAQRGRSLGVHLVLATQRPSGSVSDHIRANTNLRIALRVQDPADSRDVIDRPDAVDLPRRHPGRALARLGPGELVTFQAARVTAPGSADRRPVTVAPFGLGSGCTATDRASDTSTSEPLPSAGGETDLERLVDATNAAWAELDGEPPRRPWPDPLPTEVDLFELDDDIAHGPADLVVGRADDPDHQRHRSFAWDLDAGPLLAVGLPGSGTTTLAATVVLAAARRWPADAVHVHIIDLGAGDLAPLLRLPQVGAVVTGEDDERQRRLIDALASDLKVRRARRTAERPDRRRPRRILVVDGLASFRARWDDVEPTGTWERFRELLGHGAAVGIHVVVTADGSHAVPHAVAAACRQRLVFRLADRADHAAFGIDPAAVPVLPAGRCIAALGSTTIQIARPANGLASAAAAVASRHPKVRSPAAARRGPAAVAVLPTQLSRAELARADRPQIVAPDGLLELPLGVADSDLSVAHLTLLPGGHALVAGPPRSGRTTALSSIAAAGRDAGLAVVVVTAFGGATSASGAWGPVDAMLDHADPDLLAAIDDADREPAGLLVLVDDADLTPDDHPVLGILATERRADRHVVAAGRSDRLRSAYGHWSRELHADRTGLLLQPDPDLDGDLLGVHLPRRFATSLLPGRGWLAGNGHDGLIQVAGLGPKLTGLT